MTGIYKLYWENNPYFYYGQALNIKRRFSCHKETMRKGKHKNKKIQNIYNKYGYPKYEVLEICSKEELYLKEQYYIDKYITETHCCNLLSIASSSKGYKQSDETKEKNRLARIGMFDGENNPFYGKKHTEETKKKISEQRKGKKYPKLAEVKRGKKASDETKKKLSEIRKYEGSYKSKIVLDTQTGIFYSCAKEVSDLFSISYSTLRAKLNGSLRNNTNWLYA